jgi:hypoxanthine phosphoribosyltransferase
MQLRALVGRQCANLSYFCPSVKNEVNLGDKVFVPYLSGEKIGHAVKSVADKINSDYKGKNPLFLVILNGAFLFAADLLRAIEVDCEVSFVKFSSYEGISTTGKVKELIGLNESLEGRDVIIVEDIVDTGTTIVQMMADLDQRHTASVKIATLLIKPEAYKKEIKIDYAGLEIPNAFIVGYGLDYNGLGRNLKDIYVIKS